MAIPLERDQTTLIATINGSLSAVRPPRPGRLPKATSRSTSQLPRRQNDGRRMVGGPNEQAVVRLFSEYRHAQGIEEEEEEEDLDELDNLDIDDYKPCC